MRLRLLLVSVFAVTACSPAPAEPVLPEPVPIQESSSSAMPAVTASSSSSLDETVFIPGEAPLEDYEQRVTKKPFGMKITKGTSPVQPERFSGYHTGTDFEILPGEEDETIGVQAICDGPVKLARDVDGYGGVMVQSCEIGGETVTVLYGHIAFTLSSIQLTPGTMLMTGRTFATLGQGFTPETDGERKHLHLSIHKGTAAALAGYVQTEQELEAWIDPMTVLR